MADREYCYKEQAFFPSGEFEDDPNLGKVHRIARPHTVTGDEVDLPSSDAAGRGPSALLRFLFEGLIDFRGW